MTYVRPLVDGCAAFRYIARRTRVPGVGTVRREAAPLGLDVAGIDEVIVCGPCSDVMQPGDLLHACVETPSHGFREEGGW
jgi:hypothetical protein